MEDLKIQAPKWKMYLAGLGIILFTVIGIFMLVGDTSLFEKLVGILAIVFFGGFGGVAMYSTFVKGKSNVVITSEYLNLNFPDCPTIPLKWSDVEEFDTYKTSGQNFTTIRLKNYDNLINSLDSNHAEKIIKKFKLLKTIGQATAIIGGLNLENISKLLQTMPKSSELQNFVSFLKYSRDKFGGEFQIGWNMRDRKAKEFAEFLKEKKEKYLKASL